LSKSAEGLAVLPDAAVPRDFLFKEYSDLCALRLVVPQTGDLMIELATEGLDADEVAVLDQKGVRIKMAQHWGGGGWTGPFETMHFQDRKTPWAIVPEDAATVVLLKNGEEVARRSVHVKAGDLTDLKL
jgi:hypothetical protein